jgi:hypothetical protein
MQITPVTGKERGDIEIKNYVVLQKHQEQVNRLHPPRTLILDFTMTHTRYGWSVLNPIGQRTNTRRSDGAPETDGGLQTVTRDKIRHYRQIYLSRPDPISFMSATVATLQSAFMMTSVVYFFFMFVQTQ